MRAGQRRRKHDVLSGDAEVTAPHFSVPNEQPGNERSKVDGDREAQALARQDGRVDADDRTVGGNQRSARIPGIERRVGLHHVLDQAP